MSSGSKKEAHESGVKWKSQKLQNLYDFLKHRQEEASVARYHLKSLAPFPQGMYQGSDARTQLIELLHFQIDELDMILRKIMALETTG